MIHEYFKCPICSKTTPLKTLNFYNETDLFKIQIRECAGKKGFPLVEEFEVTDEYEEIIYNFANQIKEIYDRLAEQGYIEENEDGRTEIERLIGNLHALRN